MPRNTSPQSTAVCGARLGGFGVLSSFVLLALGVCAGWTSERGSWDAERGCSALDTPPTLSFESISVPRSTKAWDVVLIWYLTWMDTILSDAQAELAAHDERAAGVVEQDAGRDGARGAPAVWRGDDTSMRFKLTGRAAGPRA